VWSSFQNSGLLTEESLAFCATLLFGGEELVCGVTDVLIDAVD
jgi:hypothetical protein